MYIVINIWLWRKLTQSARVWQNKGYICFTQDVVLNVVPNVVQV